MLLGLNFSWIIININFKVKFILFIKSLFIKNSNTIFVRVQIEKKVNFQ